MKSALQSVIFLIAVAHSTGYQSCKQIQFATPNAPSGEYSIWIPSLQDSITVYCEMGLNNGGFTFLRPFDLPRLTDSDIQSMFTDKYTFLMRARMTDGSQKYGVLQQLSIYSPTQLKVRLSSYTSYTQPKNVGFLSTPYLFFGFMPATQIPVGTTHGLKVNGMSVSYLNCDGTPNSYIALFPNYKENVPTTYTAGTAAMATQFLSLLKPVNSRRVMPSEYFMFMEMNHGGCQTCVCGTYTQTGRTEFSTILSASIGFR